MGIFRSSEPTGGWFGPKREIHRGGNSGRNNPEGKDKRANASKKGHGTRKVKGILKKDAKAMRKYGTRGLKDRGGKGGAADDMGRWA